jgi:hypothetical protein
MKHLNKTTSPIKSFVPGTDISTWPSVRCFLSLASQLARASGQGQVLPAEYKELHVFCLPIMWSIRWLEPTRWQTGPYIIYPIYWWGSLDEDTDTSIKWASVWKQETLCGFASRTFFSPWDSARGSEPFISVQNGLIWQSVTCRGSNLCISSEFHHYLYEHEVY